MKTLKIMCICMAVMMPQMMKAALADDFAAGSGDGSSYEQALLIKTVDQLNNVRKYCKAATMYYYKMMNDIDLTEWYDVDAPGENRATSGWIPIPNTIQGLTGSAGPFYGYFDGGGFTISGLWLNKNTGTATGFFQGIAGGSEVKNLNIETSSEKGFTGVGSLGILAGNISGNATITNCHISGDVTASGANVGGIIGNIANTATFVTIQQSSYSGNIVSSGGNYVGGIIGNQAANTVIDNCSVNGNIQGSGTFIGGVVGRIAANLSLTDTYHIGNVTATGNNAGGLSGGHDNNNAYTFNMKNCYAIGNVEGSYLIGGLAGMIRMDNSATPSVTNVENCYAKGRVTSSLSSGTQQASTGGLFGDYRAAGTITNCFAVCDVSGKKNNAGGLIGVFGVAGQTTAIDIKKCYAGGSVASDADNVGGLIGNCSGTAGTIEECYVTNAVSGNKSVGGFFGNGNTLTVNNCILANISLISTNTTGNANSVGGVGNFDGKPVTSPPTTVTDCYAYENTTISGLTGTNAGIWNVPTKTKKEIRQQSTYINLGWDFDDTWDWTNESYPLPVLKGLDNQPTGKLSYLTFNDASLSALSVSAGNLSPEFSAEILNYEVTVPNEVNSIILSATTTDETASVAGTGTKSLTVGENSFDIVVTADDGETTATYTIIVDKKTATGIAMEQLQNENIKFFVKDRVIVLEGIEGIVTLSGINGISQKYTSKSSLNIPVNNPGVYILTIGKVSYKVLVF